MRNGKGRAPRPKSVDVDTFASAWDRIFAKPADTPAPANSFQVGRACDHPSSCSRNQRCSYGQVGADGTWVPCCDDATDPAAPPA